ncbi:MAG: hypothetical protein AB1633_14020, partial [Elusimicrobiota bacterium]
MSPIFGKIKKENVSEKDYVKALGLVIDGRIEEAKELFIKIVKNDSENIDAYCRLGNIFRAQCQYKKAAKIHQSLLLRPSLPTKTAHHICKELIKDYFILKDFLKAEELIKDFLNKENFFSLKEELLKVYEATGRWDAALELKKELDQFQKKDDPTILALYIVKKADIVVKTLGREARILYKDALKLDPECVSAIIGIGDSYVKERRYNDALKFWRIIIEKIPNKSFLIFDRLEKLF